MPPLNRKTASTLWCPIYKQKARNLTNKQKTYSLKDFKKLNDPKSFDWT